MYGSFDGVTRVIIFQTGTTADSLDQADIELWLTEESNKINSLLYQYYQTPIIEIDSPISFSILSNIANKLTAFSVTQRQSTFRAEELKKEKTLHDQAMEELMQYIPKQIGDAPTLVQGRAVAVLIDAIKKSINPKTATVSNCYDKKPFHTSSMW